MKKLICWLTGGHKKFYLGDPDNSFYEWNLIVAENENTSVKINVCSKCGTLYSVVEKTK